MLFISNGILGNAAEDTESPVIEIDRCEGKYPRHAHCEHHCTANYLWERER